MKAWDQVYSYYNIKSFGFKKPIEEHQTLSLLTKEINIPTLRKLQGF